MFAGYKRDRKIMDHMMKIAVQAVTKRKYIRSWKK
jgi:hypothetical protein